jgi:uncharacterized protein (TIGR03086 family)
MADKLAMWRRVADGFSERLAGVGADDWSRPTPCTEWDLRALVDHAVGAQRMIPVALGATGAIETTGEDPVAVWATVRAAADAAYAEPGALERQVVLPFGEMPAAEGMNLPIGDLLTHTWDVARATGGDEHLDEEALSLVFETLEPLDEMLRSPGFFGPKLEPAAGADLQTRYLAFVGRQV